MRTEAHPAEAEPVIAARVPPAMLDELRREAERDDRWLSSIVRIALKRHLEREARA
jgi:hypothetical protein